MLSAMGHESKSGKAKPVDWWFMYKIPRNIGPNDESEGERFLYCDNNTEN